MYAIHEIDSLELSAWQQDQKEFLLLDVRTAGEMAQGIIPGGVPTPLNALPEKITDLPKDKLVVLYCRTGARSAQATAYMTAMGFNNTYNLRGGIMDWLRQGLGVSTPDPGFFQD